VKHGLDAAAINDIFTWSLTFLDAEVRRNPTARQQLSTMASVAGGVDDRVVIPITAQSRIEDVKAPSALRGPAPRRVTSPPEDARD